jgi:bifunctional DNA-binding transcriptional regulator/antitoxin component of YhaV-PrlF toxin-antitoxin module
MAKLPPSPSDQQGFAEEQAGYRGPPAAPQRWTLKVAPDGRFVIPAAARAAMELGNEGKVTAYIEDGVLKLVSPAVAIRRIQEMLKPYRSETGSIVDEFIAERRAEAAREEREN